VLDKERTKAKASKRDDSDDDASTDENKKKGGNENISSFLDSN
jgi:hypothetical protein